MQTIIVMEIRWTIPKEGEETEGCGKASQGHKETLGCWKVCSFLIVVGFHWCIPTSKLKLYF